MTNQQECGHCVWQDLGKGTILTRVVGACVHREQEGGVFLCCYDAAAAKPLQHCPDPTINAGILQGAEQMAKLRRAGGR